MQQLAPKILFISYFTFNSVINGTKDKSTKNETQKPNTWYAIGLKNSLKLLF